MNETLKNMLSSVDWKKLVSSQDAKNALVGSALGGLMLGGAGLMAKRDPEESKFAPVGDALLGALLGGAAGYGIPKGLALFRDAGSLAPDNDKLKTNYLGWGLGGGTLGAGLIGKSVLKTIGKETNRMRGAANAVRDANVDMARSRLSRAVFGGASANEVDRLAQNLSAIERNPQGYQDDIAGLGRNILKNLKQRRFSDARTAFRRILELRSMRNAAERGYPSVKHLLGAIGNTEKPLSGGVSWADTVLHPKAHWKNFSHGSHYAPGRLLKIGPRVGAGWQMAGRAGKYGLVGAGLGMLAHKLIGLSASDNFKN